MNNSPDAAASMSAARSVLVLVDYQHRLMPQIHGGAQAVARALRLADAARELGVHIVGTEQNPAGLGPNDEAVRQRCASTLSKMHFDACEDGLLDLLGGDPVNSTAEVVVAGCEAHVCLLQTALGLLRAGRRVWVVADACASRSAQDHALAMQRLQRAGATLVSTEMVVFEWLRSCTHPRFKPVLALVKARIE
ncbi:isochorismatase family protein [uncultured Methylibium sp.]|uniref:isochorismatase family protein n=1 Tax=uncultured Methylibium sp. TaxID=381093 RepID=UPI0025CDF52E|nr:isochorismatase family protein [uncultured Methylibium sp.]